jgi:hypothetical protein
MLPVRRTRGRLFAVALATLGLWACADGPTPTAATGTPTPNVPVVTPDPVPSAATWTFCANEYAGCSFEGLRQVRYTLQGVSTVRTSFNGLPYCMTDDFGLPPNTTAPGTATCEYQTAILTRTLTVPNPGMSGLGATVVVPLGDSGFAGERIQATTDRGAPSSDIGAFRTSCTMSHFSFDDPIVYPGRPGAAHLHMFFGNTRADAASTPASIAQTGNSTCAGGIANRSAYWVPALIDATAKAVLPSDQIFYYKTGYGGVAPSRVKAMPAGLRMIAGSAASAARQDYAYWGCWEVYIGHLATIGEVTANPQCTAGMHLVMTVNFPQCWDGVNLDAPDHQSHMAYPTGSGCPATHPVALPEITMNIKYTIPATGTAGWHISSDMYDYATKGGGLSLHGDWMNGWKQDVLQAFITNCENVPKDCHAFLLGDGRTLY